MHNTFKQHLLQSYTEIQPGSTFVPSSHKWFSQWIPNTENRHFFHHIFNKACTSGRYFKNKVIKSMHDYLPLLCRSFLILLVENMFFNSTPRLVIDKSFIAVRPPPADIRPTFCGGEILSRSPGSWSVGLDPRWQQSPKSMRPCPTFILNTKSKFSVSLFCHYYNSRFSFLYKTGINWLMFEVTTRWTLNICTSPNFKFQQAHNVYSTSRYFCGFQVCVKNWHLDQIPMPLMTEVLGLCIKWKCLL